jgi:hypothetical protein
MEVKSSGQPIANLAAATTGTDSDWVVKLQLNALPHLDPWQSWNDSEEKQTTAMDLFRDVPVAQRQAEIQLRTK